MNIPRCLWRFPSGEARDKLAARFGLPNDPGMQDWEYEVSDSERIDEFLASYESGELSDDERFSLMEVILDSFWSSGKIEERSPRWLHTLDLIEKNIELHIYTVCYWASLRHSEEELEDAFDAAPDMRAILNHHGEQFSFPFLEVAEEES